MLFCTLQGQKNCIHSIKLFSVILHQEPKNRRFQPIHYYIKILKGLILAPNGEEIITWHIFPVETIKFFNELLKKENVRCFIIYFYE